MALFYFQQNAAAGGTGTIASPWNQAGLDAAIASGAFTPGGTDDLGIFAGGTPLVISAANLSGTTLFTVAGSATVQLAETVLFEAGTIDLTKIAPVAPNTISLQNNNGGYDFVVSNGTTLRLKAVNAVNGANALNINGLGTVIVDNLEAVATADLRNITVGTFNVNANLTSAFTFTGRLGAAALALSAASAQTFTVNNANFIGNQGSVTIGDNVTFATTAGSLEDLHLNTVTTSGTGSIVLTDLVAGVDTNLSRISGNVTANVATNQTTGSGINFGTLQPTIASGATLTISDDSFNVTDNAIFNGAGRVSYSPAGGGVTSAITLRAYATGGNTFNSNQNVDNAIYMGSGADVITTAGGDDTIQAGSGKDTIVTGNGVNVVRAGAGADLVTGGTGSDFVEGGGGNDTVNAGNGNNYIADGDGNESITTGNGLDTIAPGGGADVIVSGSNNDQIFAGSGKDTINAGAGNDTVTAGGGDDQILVADSDQVALDVINGGAGTDAIAFTGANPVTAVFDFDNISDVLTINNAGDNLNQARNVTFSQITETTAQTVTMNLSNNNTAAVSVTNAAASATTTFNITGGTGNDALIGSNGADTLSGGAGNDTLSGGAGSDSLVGGSGNNTYTFAAGEFIAGDTIVGNANNDTITLAANAQTVADAAFANKTLITAFTTAAGNNNITLGAFAAAASANLTVTGGTGNDTINASALGEAVSIVGGTGIDVLTGSAVNDTIVAGGGADTIVGGPGADAINVTVAADIDVVQYNAPTDGGAFVDTSAASGDVITGFQGANDDFRIQGDLLAAAMTGVNNNAVNAIGNTAGIDLTAAGTGDDLVQIVAGAGGNTAAAADLITLADINAALGAITNDAVGQERIFGFNGNDGNSFALYYWTSVNGDGNLEANELTLLGTLAPGAAIVANNFVFA